MEQRGELRLRLLLAVGEEGPETNTSDLDDSEAHTGNISLRATTVTEARNEDLVVLINVGEGTVPRYEGSDLLAVLDQLHTHSLTDGRVRLLSLNTKTLDDDALSLRSSSQRVGLDGSAEVSLLVVNIVPSLNTAVVGELTSSLDTSRFTSHTHKSNSKHRQNKG